MDSLIFELPTLMDLKHNSGEASLSETGATAEGTGRVRWGSLAFPQPQEVVFRQWYLQSMLTELRVALLLGLVLYSVFGVLDYLLVPEQLFVLSFIRFGIVAPMIILVFACSFFSFFIVWHQWILSSSSALAGLGIVVMIGLVSPEVQQLYYAGIMLVQIYAALFIRLYFRSALLVNVVLAAAYLIFVVFQADGVDIYLLNNLFFLFSAAVMTLTAGFWIEKSVRLNFSQARALDGQNVRLQKKNDDLRDTLEQLAAAQRQYAVFFAAYAKALPGTALQNKYEIKELLGAGGVGTVYRARHRELGHELAVKLFRVDPRVDPQTHIDRMRREGVISKKNEHPNAVKVMDMGVAEGVIPYLVMELLNGNDLEAELAAGGVLSAKRCAEILIPVCNVLENCHALGFVHRDIKPSNIFLHRENDQEVVKVIDFGVAKAMEPIGLPALTDTGVAIGTPFFMAPEVFLGEAPSPASDVYAVGVVLHLMLTGEHPRSTSLYSPNHASPELVFQVFVPEDIRSLVMQMVHVETALRPTLSSVRTILHELG